MAIFQTYSYYNPPAKEELAKIAFFLFEQLGKFGDPLPDIQNAIGYALRQNESPGGILITSRNGSSLTGAVVVNKTGMKGYIPENILVYIAVHEECRGQGIGRQLMIKALELSEGNMALHVEPDNPAKGLYESLGFTNKYLEMRLNK